MMFFFVAANTNDNIRRLLEQVSAAFKNPQENRELIAVILIVFVFLMLILVLSFIGVQSYLDNRRVKKAIKRRKRKLTPFEAAMRTFVFSAFLIALVAAYYYTHYQSSFCSNCHEMKFVVEQHKRAPNHKNVACINCHLKPGLIGKFESLPREARNLLVHWDLARPQGIQLTFEESCINCHRKEMGKTLVNMINVRHSDFIYGADGKYRCSLCHKGTGHEAIDVYTKNYCVECHDGRKARPMKDCKTCHRTDVTLKAAFEGEQMFRTVGTGELRCKDTCHSPAADAKCTPCHGTEMPHPQTFIKQHALNSYNNRELCVRCHAKWGATTSRTCGCHPAEGDTMHGTYEFWFIEHQEAARTNPYYNCLCHATSPYSADKCDFCHIEGSPLKKSMIEQEYLQRQQMQQQPQPQDQTQPPPFVQPIPGTQN